MENAMLFLMGAISACLIEAVLLWFYLSDWIKKDCKEQGPDYIRARIRAPIFTWAAIGLGLVFVLAIVDYFYLRNRGTLVNVVRKLPFLAEWGDVGVMALYLWLGTFVGVLVGAFVGTFAAIYGIPTRNHKCRRLLGGVAS